MSKIEVNAIEPQCGTNLTVGASGDTITFPSGTTVVNNGSQTGFGRTGTVDWDTTAKTASFTAVSGNGYFVNTTSSAITLTLPASPSAGDIVSFKDYAFTFATNNLTVDGNGSPIGGVDGNINPTYDTNGTSKTFIYVDGTKGWLVTNESTDTSQESNALYVTATGGTITTCGNFKIHTFTGPGTFCVSCAGNACGSNTVDYLVIAGGGGGGMAGTGSSVTGGAGGAGGYRESSGAASGCYTVSPLGACVSALPVTAQGYPITVSGGGAGGTNVPDVGNAANGGNSIFSSITSTGGGAGGTNSCTCSSSGGSGGGGKESNGTGSAGNTPPVSPPQGNPGGNGNECQNTGGGGGGAIAAGGTYPNMGDGGAGATSSINGTPTVRASGGSANGQAAVPGGGGRGGRADGLPSTAPVPYNAGNGSDNTGGGGGAQQYDSSDGTAGNGGSGVVIIRYKFQ